MKNYVKNRNSVRWFNEKYADLSAEELIERYNSLFGGGLRHTIGGDKLTKLGGSNIVVNNVRGC